MAPGAGKTITLRVLRGPDAGTEARFDKPTVIIGRKRGDFLMSDRETSGIHAAIEAMRSGEAIKVLVDPTA